MRRPVTKLGKVGNKVWGKNRHGQTCYALVIPTNPRTEPQQANRGQFGSVGPGWRWLTDPQRALWKADGRLHRTHGRPGRSAPLTGFQRYMQVNAPRARQGLPLLEEPPSSFSIHPSSFPAAPSPCWLHHSCTPRVPMQHRTHTAATRSRHPWPPLGPCGAPVHARTGPGPPRLLSSPPKPRAQGPHNRGSLLPLLRLLTAESAKDAGVHQ
jgi:hypothetical protein